MSKQEDGYKVSTVEAMSLIRKMANIFVMSGHRPKANSDNPLESVLFEALSLIAQWEKR